MCDCDVCDCIVLEQTLIYLCFLSSALATLKPQAGMAVAVPPAASVQVSEC